MAPKSPDDQTRLSKVRARQGVTGNNVRIVLFVSLTLAVVAGVILLFSVGRPS